MKCSFFLTIFTTVTAGTLVFVLGQIFLKLVLEPVHNFKRVIAEIAHALIYYADVYSNPSVISEDNAKEAHNTLRRLSSELEAVMHLVPLYQYISKIFCLPKAEKVRESSKFLIGLSNGVYNDRNENAPTWNCARSEKIAKNLGIYTPEL